jgi:hypothetical protein
VLLELMGAAAPIESWPDPATRRERAAHSRQAAQGQAAQGDRPGTPDRAKAVAAGESPAGLLDRERRRRRQAAVAARPDAPARLGEAIRRRPLFLVEPDEDAGRDQ